MCRYSHKLEHLHMKNMSIYQNISKIAEHKTKGVMAVLLNSKRQLVCRLTTDLYLDVKLNVVVFWLNTAGLSSVSTEDMDQPNISGQLKSSFFSPINSS